MIAAIVYAAALVGVLVYIRVRLGFFVTSRACLLGWIWMVCGPPHLYYWFSGKLEPALFERITWAFLVMWVAMVGGMELARLWTPRQFRAAERIAHAWRFEPVAPGYITKTTLTAIGGLGLVFMIWVSVTENHIGRLAEFVSLQGQTWAIAELRGTQGGSRLYLYNVFLFAIAPFLSLVLLLRPASHLLVYSVIRYGFIGCVLIGKAAMLNRSSLAIYLIQLVSVSFLLKDNRVRLVRVLGGVVMVALAVLPFFYHYLGDVSFSQFVTFYFFDRVFMAPYYGMITYYELYPDIVPFALGRNIRVINWFWYHGEAYTPVMFALAQDAGNFLGSFNAGFVAEAWADFGYVGVFVTSAVLGVTTALADLVIFDRAKTREGAAILVCMAFGVITVSQTAAQTALFSGGLALIPLIAAVLKLRLGPARATAARAPGPPPILEPRPSHLP